MNNPLMDPIEGATLRLSFISDRTWGWVADLLYYDGPLCVHYTCSDGTHWLYWWIDCNSTHNRWLLLCLPAAEIEAWRASGMDNSRDLWRKATQLVVADLNSEGVPDNLVEVSFEGLSEDWLPTDFVEAGPTSTTEAGG